MGGLFYLLFSLCLFGSSSAWDSDDLEVFDVVDEVGQNFYELLQIKQDASAFEIRKAFRQLSLVLHPDKNPAPDAEVQFRNLVSVYDVLKDVNKRRIYHDVLENGLPDWRQAVYYYRRVRKMSLIEMTVILFIIITVGQYLVAWAAYYEKRYAVQEFINTKKKSLVRKQKRGKIEQGTVEMLPEMLVGSISKPSFSCTLPVQICKLIWFLLIQFPPLLYCGVREYIKNRNNKPVVEEESSSEEEVVVRERAPRRRTRFKAPEVTEYHTAQPIQNAQPAQNTPEPTKPVLRGGLWTDDDFDDLIRLMKKFPAGSVDRWEKIGESMLRPAQEVAHMAHKIKDQGFNPFRQTEEEETVLAVPKKVKTRKEEALDQKGDVQWSQVQQKALETALSKFPKGTAGDRWDKIAALVPGKTKEECMHRFKMLADMVKKKKDKPSNEEGECEETVEPSPS